MKKIFTFCSALTLAGLFLFGNSSCTREYTCQCIMSYSGVPGLPDSTTREYTIQDTKKKAQDLCRGNSKVYQEGNITTREECDLW